MLYHSTRNADLTANSAQAVLEGLAADGGLYVPCTLPEFDWVGCLQGNSLQMQTQILSALLPDIPDMPRLVQRAYAGKFETPELTPTVSVGDFSVLELFRGPTSAFKDIALSMLPQLLTAARTACGVEKPIRILTATSGDTGKAALVGFQDVPGVEICVFYPHGGVSQVQRAQMVTQEGANVAVCAVEGNFDDAQTGVKQIFTACRDKELPFRLSSANSINIGRLAPQIMYYFRSYKQLLEAGRIRLGDKVNYAVPTGNFGDILAGWFAKRLGLPVGRLICASNANRVLTDFIRTGTYDRRRPLLKTESPSMDILVSSNLERLLYLLCKDAGKVAQMMEALRRDGVYTVPDELLAAIQAEFDAGYCDDARAREVIGRVYAKRHYLCDPHTAAGWAAAEDYVARTGDTTAMVVLSTASPFKFPEAVLTAIGADTSGSGFDQMERLSKVTGVPIPAPLAALRGKPERHTRVIAREAMTDYVLSL